MSERRVLVLAILAVGTVAAWVAVARLPLPARALTAFLLVPLPAFMRWQARRAESLADVLPRTGLYLGSALLLWTLAALVGVTAAAAHLSLADLGLTAPGLAVGVAWTAGTFAAAVAVLLLGRLVGMAETPMVRRLIPVTGVEKLAFGGLSLTAGFAEELIFRGFLLWALLQASSSAAISVVASSAVFGILHAYQDVSGAARAAVLGAILATPVLATGSILPSMVAHAAIDLTSGLVLARWLLGD